MAGFRASSGGVTARFARPEAAIIRDLVEQVVELVVADMPAPESRRARRAWSGSASRPRSPDDPVLARLLPDAYRDDPDAAQRVPQVHRVRPAVGQGGVGTDAARDAACQRRPGQADPRAGRGVAPVAERRAARARRQARRHRRLRRARARTSRPMIRVSPMSRFTSGWPTSRAAWWPRCPSGGAAVAGACGYYRRHADDFARRSLTRSSRTPGLITLTRRAA